MIHLFQKEDIYNRKHHNRHGKNNNRPEIELGPIIYIAILRLHGTNVRNPKTESKASKAATALVVTIKARFSGTSPWGRIAFAIAETIAAALKFTITSETI